ncbi:MAG: hypothetical protein ACI4U5_00020 [Bacilli bacterium]
MYSSYFSPLYGYGINRQVMPSFYRTFRSIAPPVRTNGFTIEKILSRTQRSINTINQIIPLYKQVKPIYNQGKNMVKSFASFINKSFGQPINRNSENKTNTTSFNRYNNGASNPFF